MRIVQRPLVDGDPVPESYVRVARFTDPDVYVYLDSSEKGVYKLDFVNTVEAADNCRVLRNGVLWDIDGNLVDISENLGILERIGVRIITTHDDNPEKYAYDMLVRQIPSEWTRSKFILEFTVSVPLPGDAPPFYATRVAVYKFPEDGPPAKRRRIEPEEDLTECMICLSNPPDTLVTPCMHRVVCRECSKKLKNTPDCGVCVRCRREIEAVYHDEV